MRNANPIVVAGAGIIGASIAWHLAARGATVTIIDQEAAGAAASGKSFGWLNASYGKLPYHYHRLSRVGVGAWREAAGKLPLAVRWGGALSWAHAPSQDANHVTSSAPESTWAGPVATLEAGDIRRMEPQLVLPGNPQGRFSALDGWLDAAAATRVLLDAAQSSGATFVAACELLRCTFTGQRLTGVVTTNGNIDARQLVVACGANADIFTRAGQLTIPQQPTAGVIVTTDPLPPTISHLLIANGTYVYQRIDGALVLGEAQPLSAAAGDPISDAQIARAAEQLVAKVSEFLPAAADAPVATASLGWRPMPRDGYPAIGRCPGHPEIYAAVTHSGVTLAIILGQLIAREVLDDLRVGLLTPYRPERF